MADKETYLESDGKAVEVALTSTVSANEVAYAEGWIGINVRDGDSGDNRAFNIDDREYQWYIPDALAVNKGDTVYVDVTDLTGHIPDDSAYYTASGAGRIALCKATSDKDTSRGTGEHWCSGKSLLNRQGA